MKNLGGNSIKVLNLEMEFLIDDEVSQIINSHSLFNAFDRRSKTKKYYNTKGIKYLFEYVILIYNEASENIDRFGGLTYLMKISDCLDYLKISNILELSLKQLNLILDCSGHDINEQYKKIITKRHTIVKSDFSIYVDMLKNHGRYVPKTSKEAFKYLANLYNENTIIQDNIHYIKFLKYMSSIKQSDIFHLRMFEIMDICRIDDVNSDTIYESKKMLTNLSKAECTL